LSSFIEQCRREWKRLGVPDSVAEEMATDLAADLQEAKAEGASPEDVLGADAGDPRVFAASWAIERGVATRQPKSGFRRHSLLIVVAVAVTLLAVSAFLSLIAFGQFRSAKSAVTVTVPNLLAYKQGQAANIALSYGFMVTTVTQKGSPDGFVFAQSPIGGTSVPRRSTVTIYVNTCRKPDGCYKHHSVG
jgi:hypothetical protein